MSIFSVKQALEQIGEIPREHRLSALLILEKECQALERELALNAKATSLDIIKVRELADGIRKALKAARKK